MKCNHQLPHNLGEGKNTKHPRYITGLTISINGNDLSRVETAVGPAGKDLVIHMKTLKDEQKKQ